MSSSMTTSPSSPRRDPDSSKVLWRPRPTPNTPPAPDGNKIFTPAKNQLQDNRNIYHQLWLSYDPLRPRCSCPRSRGNRLLLRTQGDKVTSVQPLIRTNWIRTKSTSFMVPGVAGRGCRGQGQGQSAAVRWNQNPGGTDGGYLARA